MDVPRILIVEDDAVMSMHLETLIGDTLPAEVVTVCSVAEARAALDRRPSFALLDVDVADGTTYELAEVLRGEAIPFAFVSASERATMPVGLRDVPFVAKPYDDGAIVALLGALGGERRG